MIEHRDSGFSMCQLSLPGFDGSADSYLGLVAQHKVSVELVPVADVTKQFLSHLTDSERLDLHLAGELMAASARLMAMKSAHLLLQPSEEEDQEPLPARVFDPTERDSLSGAIESLSAREGQESFGPFATSTEMERQSEPRSPALLKRAWHELQTRAAAPERRVAVPGFVRLEVAVSGLIRALRSGSAVVFRHFTGGSSRIDTVMHFMAVLELVRQRRVHTVQEELFADITVLWASDSAETSAQAG